MAKKKINVQGLAISIERRGKNDYVSLTDIAKQSTGEPRFIIQNWMRNTGTVRYLYKWEETHNPDFNRVHLHTVLEEATDNRLIMSPTKWIEMTNAIGITTKAGRYGGTYGHWDIVINFCYWLSPEFQVYLIKEFQRLKEEEAKLLGESWNIQRLLTKANFHLQTAAVRENLVPLLQHNTKREGFYHASEADQLNLIVFGMTAKQWKQANPKKKGNIRDHATKLELVILNNLQAINSVLITDGMAKELRAAKLLKIAATQMEVLLNTKPLRQLGGL